MKTRNLLIPAAALVLPWLLFAQSPAPATAGAAASPAKPRPLAMDPQAQWLPDVAPSPTPAGATPTPAPAAPSAPSASSASSARPAPSSAASTIAADAVPLPATADGGTAATGTSIRLNFQGAQLSDVLNYLSEAAGFVIIQDTPVNGTVNILSRQPLSPDEAVDLLNTVLLEKNYVAIRNGRFLKIVNRADAQKRDLPVVTGADPNRIPHNDTMVTQILPVRYADVSKLIDNLRPLLSDNASITANDSSNAIILTDSQANVRRMAEIIRALDTSISGISSIHVFPLRYADAKEIADVLTQLFQTNSTSSNNNQQRGGQPFPMFGGFGQGGGRRGGDQPSEPQSQAREAASRVVAVSDQTSNSVIVSAPDEYMDTISEVVSRLDTSINAVTETRIFRLLHADATEMSVLLTALYSDTTSATTAQRNNRNQGPQPPWMQQQQQQGQQGVSQRALLQAKMVAVADPRTNSVIITASHDMMEEVSLTVGRLDASDAKKQHVRVYTLENADPDNVASILRGMFTVNGVSSNQSANSTNALSQRVSAGASSDVTNTLNTNSSSSGSRGTTGR